MFFPKFDLWGPCLRLRNGFQHQAGLAGDKAASRRQVGASAWTGLAGFSSSGFVFLRKGSFHFNYIRNTWKPSRCDTNIQAIQRESKKPLWEMGSQPVAEGEFERNLEMLFTGTNVRNFWLGSFLPRNSTWEMGSYGWHKVCSNDLNSSSIGNGKKLGIS